MITNLCGVQFGTEMFGYGTGPVGNPAIFVFGFPIYLYALIITTGMCLAILIGGLYFKKRGYDPYDITIYALAVIPMGVLGARLYVYIFPWSGQVADWSTFFNFRNGGLGIYGGVILGYLTAVLVAKIRKQDFRIVGDCIMPGLFLAQSIGRWGNFVNQEAFGNLVSNPNLQFFPYAVYIDRLGGWYQATFFYESICTLIGFLICVFVLMPNKHYKLGWTTAFYGIYYGIVRLFVEGLRSDSLFLYIGTWETDIKISQLVSVFTIILGLWTLSQIYRKDIHKLYSKLFKTELQEVKTSRFVLLGVSIVALSLAVVLFVLGGESNFIAGFFLALLGVYSALGIWSLQNRLQLYCPTCGSRMQVDNWQTKQQQSKMQFFVFLVLAVLCFVFATFSLIKWGIADGIANGIVLAVIFYAFSAMLVVFKVYPNKNYPNLDNSAPTTATCNCGHTHTIKLNTFLLLLFPPKVYRDYGVEGLVEWVDPEKLAKQQKKAQANNTEE
ncbi:MAG: prolipoprotein diacylglyceryl transferase [Clostridia bacterium]|nr:prolipoprotein diacylglyceryl transferase [Clostridia bacterium]